jgi:hypothetical protein
MLKETILNSLTSILRVYFMLLRKTIKHYACGERLRNASSVPNGKRNNYKILQNKQLNMWEENFTLLTKYYYFQCVNKNTYTFLRSCSIMVFLILLKDLLRIPSKTWSQIWVQLNSLIRSDVKNVTFSSTNHDLFLKKNIFSNDKFKISS